MKVEHGVSFSTAVHKPGDRLAVKIKESLLVRGSGFLRVEVELDRIDPLTWLSCQPGHDKVYWLDRDGQFESAGVGIADVLNTENSGDFGEIAARIDKTLSTAASGSRYYGGLRFSPAGSGKPLDPEWLPFGDCRFVLPRCERLN